MKVAIMQPYFMPYIGYYQLIAAVDVFVVYDQIKYTKKGWINRNRILQNGKENTISIPLKAASDTANIDQRVLAESFDRRKLLNQIAAAYSRAPFFSKTFALLESVIWCSETNLFAYLHNSLLRTCEHIGITTPIKVSSELSVSSVLKSQDRVIALCEALQADTYINAIGGVELYSKEVFSKRQLDLKFIRSKSFEYNQFGNSFVPWLSIIDVLMFNSIDDVLMAITSNCEFIECLSGKS